MRHHGMSLREELRTYTVGDWVIIALALLALIFGASRLQGQTLLVADGGQVVEINHAHPVRLERCGKVSYLVAFHKTACGPPQGLVGIRWPLIVGREWQGGPATAGALYGISGVRPYSVVVVSAAGVKSTIQVPAVTP